MLPDKIIEKINDKKNRCYISIASIWEIAIKLSLNKLVIKGGFNTIEDFLNNNDFEILPIDFDDIKTLLKLEMIQRDPFDRMIISQAQTTNSTIISKDKQFRNYNVKIMW